MGQRCLVAPTYIAAPRSAPFTTEHERTPTHPPIVAVGRTAEHNRAIGTRRSTIVNVLRGLLWRGRLDWCQNVDNCFKLTLLRVGPRVPAQRTRWRAAQGKGRRNALRVHLMSTIVSYHKFVGIDGSQTNRAAHAKHCPSQNGYGAGGRRMRRWSRDEAEERARSGRGSGNMQDLSSTFSCPRSAHFDASKASLLLLLL
eukprot:5341637-Pyramimonas_sp.AAC.1